MLYYNLINKEGNVVSELVANHVVTVEEALDLIGVENDPSDYSIVEVEEKTDL